ncbi:MAG: ATP synthase F1 subunit delta [Dehalococcoidales bacterium]|nr:ATP synthase F1 subunit delta [Dehalococcoidales bacterium]
MATSRVNAKRYAQAIFEIAQERQELTKWQADLQRMAALRHDPVLLTLLASPKLTFQDKTKLVDEQLEGISPLARNLAYLLVEKNKISWIGNIAEAYQQLVDNYNGIQHAVVTTALPVEGGEAARLEEALTSLTGKKIILRTETDAGIIGGMIARIDGQLLDGSVRSKLLALKKELAGREK